MPGIVLVKRKAITGKNPPHKDPVRTDLLPEEARVILKELELMGQVGGGTVHARWDFSYLHTAGKPGISGTTASLILRNGSWRVSAARGSHTKWYKKPETALKHFAKWLKDGCPYGAM
jgi:hypothetical protein